MRFYLGITVGLAILCCVATANARKLGDLDTNSANLAPNGRSLLETCSDCRYIPEDFPIFAECSGAGQGEAGYCCSSQGKDDLDCQPRDAAHGGYSCADSVSMGTIDSQYIYAHCCYC